MIRILGMNCNTFNMRLSKLANSEKVPEYLKMLWCRGPTAEYMYILCQRSLFGSNAAQSFETLDRVNAKIMRIKQNKTKTP
jgi:hypothetical protein